MAIVQISQITNRKGLNSNLPQLAGAELGWSADTRQLYIGNGTLEDGAPIIGNTEILTEFSVIPPPTPSLVTLINNTTSPTLAFRLTANTAIFSYTIVRGSTYRSGIIKVAGTDLQDDNYAESSATGITFSASYTSGQIDIQYVSTNAGTNAQMSYLVTISA